MATRPLQGVDTTSRITMKSDMSPCRVSVRMGLMIPVTMLFVSLLTLRRSSAVLRPRWNS